MADEVFEAELFDEMPAEEQREKRQLNGAMGATIAIVVLFLVLAATVGIPHGMMGTDGAANSHWLPPVEDRTGKIYDNGDVFSRVSWNGSHNISAVQSIFVDVPAITLADGGAGAHVVEHPDDRNEIGDEVDRRECVADGDGSNEPWGERARGVGGGIV